RAFVRVRAVERGHDGVRRQEINVAGKRAGWHLQRSEIMPVARKVLDLRVRAVGNIELLRSRYDRNAMPGAELVRRIAFAAEGQSVPGGVKRADADDPGGQDEVEIRVARRDIVKPVEVFDVGGREVAATAKIVVNLGVFEILIAGGLVEC